MGLTRGTGVVLLIAVAVAVAWEQRAAAQDPPFECVVPNGTHCTCQNKQLFACPVPNPDREGFCIISPCSGIVCSCDFDGSPTALCKIEPLQIYVAGDFEPGGSEAPCSQLVASVPYPQWASIPN